jgi:hypothetical protein
MTRRAPVLFVDSNVLIEAVLIPLSAAAIVSDLVVNQIPPEQQDFIPDSADEGFTKWYYGRVRAKPAWQAEDQDIDDDDE